MGQEAEFIKEKGGIFMKMKRVSSLLLLSLIFGIFITGVSMAQAAKDEDRFTVKLNIGALGLFRQGNDNIPLVTDSFAPSGNTLVNANDLNLGIAPGLDASVTGRYRMFGLEFRYFGIFEYSSSEDASSAAGAVIQYQTPIGNTTFPGIVNADYNSMVHNIEANVRWWPIDRLSILAGFRYLILNEDLTIGHDIGPGLNFTTHEIETDNTLLGGQVGLEGTILRFKDAFFEGDELSFGGWAKGGYFNNHIKTDIAITQPIGSSFFAKGSNDKGTFLCEGAVNVGYKITRNVAVDLRYQVLWIQNAGLAPEQVTHSDPGISGIASTKAQSVLYHGPWVGVVLSF
jgi:hypothetical protein